MANGVKIGAEWCENEEGAGFPAPEGLFFRAF